MGLGTIQTVIHLVDRWWQLLIPLFINTRNENQLHKPIANLSHLRKSAYYAGIKVLSNLPPSLTIIVNKKEQFKVALKRYLITHTFYFVDEFVIFTNNS
jgi:hypothetical protein